MAGIDPKEGPDEIVIIDENEPCPYLCGRVARMPLRMPLEKISKEMTDLKLAEGFRRTSSYLYDTQCAGCQACIPIRIDCNEFKFSKNQRRVLNRGDRKFEQSIQSLVADQNRVQLFNRHRDVRGLADADSNIDLDGYHWGFVRSCFDSFELNYRMDGKLVCVGICDRGNNSISAVYTFYDPSIERDSIGTYSILKQIEFCQQNEYRYLYLGYYIRESRNMNYKARFLPHEKRIDGKWVRFDSC